MLRNFMARFIQSVALFFLLMLVPCTGKAAPEIHVAVASNFALCFESLARDFTSKTGIPVVSSPGSTGRHFAQIKAGAPFHVFLSADELRPRLLEECGLTVPGSRFTYATGRLVFWCPAASNGLAWYEPLAQMISSEKISHLAVANARLAPYGKAARQVLEFLGLGSAMNDRIVTGQNISQTWQFVASGNAEAGLVGLSQVMESSPNSWRLIDGSMHEPILQQAVILSGHGRENRRELAERLLLYLRSPDAQQLMADFGYDSTDEKKQ